MKVRLHRGTFEDSMATTKTIEPNLEALTAFFAADVEDFVGPVTNIEVSKYGPPSDHRNGWDTHIVTGDCPGLTHRAVLGYTDQALPRKLPKVCGRVLAMTEIIAAKTAVISRKRMAQWMGTSNYIFRLKRAIAPGKNYRLVRIKSLRAAQFDTMPVLLISDDSIRTLQVKSFVKERGWDEFLASTDLGEVIPLTEDMLVPVTPTEVPKAGYVYVRHSGLMRHTTIIGHVL